MAKRKKANTVAKAAAAAAAAAVQASAREDDDDRLLLNFGDEDEDEEEANDILEGLEQLDEGGDVTYWELYCDTPLEKAGQIRKLATSELRGLRDECLALGPGEYHVIARGRTGKFVPKSRRRIKISGFARPAAPAAAPANAIDPLSLMQQMEERLERRRLEAKRERDAMIKFWAPLLAPIGIELAKNLFSRGGESMKDLVGALVGMKDLVGAGGKDSNAVDTLLKGIELARDLDPGSSKGSTWPDALINGVATVAKEFRPLAESIAQRRGVAVPPPAGPAQLQFQPTTPGGATPSAPASGAPLPAPTTEDNNMLAMVTPLLQRLAGELEEYAANATDAGLTAEALLAKIPRTLRAMVSPEQMQTWLQEPGWWAHAVQFHPGLAPYQAFCDDVRLALLDLVTEAGEASTGEES